MYFETNEKLVFDKSDFIKLFNKADVSTEKNTLDRFITNFATDYMAKWKILKGFSDFFTKRPNGRIRLDLKWY